MIAKRHKAGILMRWTITIVAVAFFMRGTVQLAQAKEPTRAGKQKSRLYSLRPPWLFISKETTFLTEPLGKDGFVDYLTALNQQARKGVTRDNNSVSLFWQAVGLGIVREEYFNKPQFKTLGIELSPKNGRYFVDIDEFLRSIALKRKIHGTSKEKDEAVQKFVDEVQERMSGEVNTKPWSADEYPLVAKWLAHNAQPLQMFVEGAKRSQYFSPLMIRDEFGNISASDLADRTLFYDPLNDQLREMARALLARAMLRLNNGNYRDAWKDVISSLRGSRLVGRGPTAFNRYANLYSEVLALKAAAVVLSHPKVSETDLQAFQNDLINLPDVLPITEQVDKAERFVFLYIVGSIPVRRIDFETEIWGRKDDPSQRTIGLDITQLVAFYLVDWNSVLRTGNAWYDKQLAALRLPTRIARREAQERITEDRRQVDVSLYFGSFQSRIPVIMVPQRPYIDELVTLAIGYRLAWTNHVASKFVVYILDPAPFNFTLEDSRTARFRFLKIALALSAYKLDHGEFPENLKQLEPKYLANVPGDLYVDAPFQYKRQKKGYFLYSVGQNQQDDDGVYDLANEFQSGDDIGMRFPPEKFADQATSASER